MYSEVDEAADISKEKLVADFKVVVADAEALLRATANDAGEKVVAAREKIQSSLVEAKAQLVRAEAAIIDKTKQAARATDQYVHDNPWKAVGISACVGLVIGVFYLVDLRAIALDAAAADGPAPAAGNARVPLSMEGKINLPLLMAVIGAVFLPTPWREMAMAAAAVVSVWKTPAKVREENEFTWHPIEEVAILFAGIFATMIPALLILKARGAELGVVTPAHFFWATGMLSSFLDNAPTYLTFFSLAQGVGGTQTVAGVSAPLLQAIGAGAVFMGANSYIGNAPNFMVKAIAEEAGVRMPSFFGYMAWSCVVLLPIFFLLTLIFF